MKYWTEHQARANQTAEADQLNAEMRASQSAITTLDRTQTPSREYDPTNVGQYALHQVWTSGNSSNPMWAPGDEQGEQTNVRSDTGNTRGDQWMAITYQGYNGGWETAYTETLTGFRGGHLHVEWSGQASIFPAFQQTQNNFNPANPKHMRLRIQVAGVTMVERQGTAKSMASFRIFGGGLYPQGDLEVQFQWRFTPAGQDDAIVDNGTSDYLMQAHLWGNKVLAIARYK